MNSTLMQVEDVVRAAASSLGKSLGSYWPTCGDQGAHERNISLHVAHAFLNKGYATFGESHGHNDNAQERFDLVAIPPAGEHVIACEFKQLYKRPMAVQMLADFERLREYTPLRELGTAPVIGVIAAFVTAEKFAVPFDKDRQRDGQVTECDLTQQLCNKFPQGSRLGCVRLFAGEEPSLKAPAFVYAVFDTASVAA